MASELSQRDLSFLEKLSQRGISRDRQYELLNKARAQQGLPEVEPAGKTGEFFTSLGKGLYGVGSQLSRLAPGDQSADPNSYYNRSQELMRGADIERRKVGQDPESTTSKVGQFVGETLPTIPLSMGASAALNLGVRGLAAVAPSAAARVSPFLSLGLKPSVGNVAKFGAFEGAKDQAIYDLTTKGKTDARSIATGAAAGTVLGLGLRGLGKVFDKTLPPATTRTGTSGVERTFRQEMPVRLVENNLNFNPNQIEKFKSQFKMSPGEYLLQNNLAGKPKEELFDLFNQKFTNAYTKKTEMLAPINQRYKHPEIDEMLDIIARNVQDSAGDMAKADFNSYLGAINNFRNLKQYTLKDTVDIIREFDNWLKIYDAKGFVKGTGANKSLAKLRDRVTDFVDNKARSFGVDLGQMNKDIRVSKQFQDGLFRSIIKDDKNNLLGLNDLLLGNLLSGGDPFTGFAVTLAKKGLTGKMQTTLPKVAQKLYKNYGQPISGNPLNRTSRSSTSKSPFTSRVDSVGGSEVEALPSPSGLPLSPRKASGKYTETIPQGRQKILPDNPIQDITSRSKIVKPGTYTETPVKKEVQATTKKLRTNEDALGKKPQKTTEVVSTPEPIKNTPEVKETPKTPQVEGKTGVNVVKAERPTEYKITEDKYGFFKMMQKNPRTGKWEVGLADLKSADEARQYIPKGATIIDDRKSSLPLSSKSEVKYSKPIEKELEPVMKATKESRFVKKPVVIKKDVYRGVSNDEYAGKGMATYGNGLYTTTNKSIAKEYAGSNGKLLEISKTQLPENALHFDTVMDYKNWLDYDVQKKLGMKASEFNAKYPDIGEFIKSLGYDGIVVGKGEIMVTYP